MNYLYLLFVILAPAVALALAFVAVIMMFECFMDYRDETRDRKDTVAAASILFTVLFVSATAFYYSLPVFVKEVL